MNKFLLLLSLVMTVIPGISQNSGYEKQMSETLHKLNSSDEPDMNRLCAEQFEQISETYTDQWLPLYHGAMALTTISFEDADKDRGDAQLERATKSLEKAFELAPEESELYVLEAMITLAKITLDPEVRGPTYFGVFYSALGKAKERNPQNPRVYYLEALMTLNMPEMMGGGPEAAKPIFQDAAEKFRSFSSDIPFWPDWGEELNQSELAKLEEI